MHLLNNEISKDRLHQPAAGNGLALPPNGTQRVVEPTEEKADAR